MISLCMIVKDEAEALERCVLSVRPAVAEVVVVDTGSTDSTPELAQGLGARVLSHDFSDQDFSRARNLALEQATQPWVLVLDADEELHPADLGRLLRLVRRGGADAYRLWRYNYMGNGWCLHLLTRLFKNHPRIRYRNRLHESVDPALSELGLRTAEAGFPIHHYGFLRPLEWQEARDRRYILAEEAESRRHPGDWLLRLLLAERCCRVDRVDEALAVAREVQGQNPRLVWGYMVEAQAHLAAGRPDRARALCWRALEELESDDRLRRAVYNSLGMMALEGRDPREALRLFAEAERCDPGRAHLCVNRGLAWERLGRLREARREFLHALRLNPMLARHPPGMHPECRERYRYETETAPDFGGIFHHLGRNAYGRLAARLDGGRLAAGLDGGRRAGAAGRGPPGGGRGREGVKMYILGLNFSGHDAAAALLDEGGVVMAVEEERLARVKHIDRFPAAAIRACLGRAGIGPEALDEVALYLDPSIYLRRLFSDLFRYFPHSAANFPRHWARYRYWNGRKDAIPRDIGCCRARFHFVPHHLCHAAAGFFTSPFEEAAILTVDGIGEWTTAALGEGRGNQIRILKQFHTRDSLGHFYSFVTEHLGFQKNDGEGKVMGLAAFGRPAYLELFSEMVRLEEDGYSLDSSWFNWDGGRYRRGPRGWVSEKYLRHLGPPRPPGAPLEQRHRDIACSAQAVLERTILHLAGLLRRLTARDDLVVSGGVGLNSVINGLIPGRTGFKRVFVPSAPGDSGASLGAALYVRHSVLGGARRPGPLDPYLGPEQSEDETRRFLDSAGLSYRTVEDPAAACAGLLAQGAIVGWLQGRMEFGPRALGNRSILCDPVKPEMKDVLNLRVKHREPFRPYAPSIPAGRAGLYFDPVHPSPYMSITLPVKPEGAADFPAAIHVDGTARLQTVEREQNPRYFDLLEAFGRATGRYVVLNTSFNVQGEPIVCTAQDAVRCFYTTGMDHLFLGPFLLSKRMES